MRQRWRLEKVELRRFHIVVSLSTFVLRWQRHVCRRQRRAAMRRRRQRRRWQRCCWSSRWRIAYWPRTYRFRVQVVSDVRQRQRIVISCCRTTIGTDWRCAGNTCWIWRVHDIYERQSAKLKLKRPEINCMQPIKMRILHVFSYNNKTISVIKLQTHRTLLACVV